MEQGTHDELLQVPITRSDPPTNDGDDEGPINGYYHHQWETRMGEEAATLELSTASASQVAQRMAHLQRELAKVQKELGRWQQGTNFD